MGNLRTNIVDGDIGQLDDTNKVHAFYNGVVQGPFTLTHDLSNIDSGVPLWTPAIGDRLLGVWVEFTEAWSVSGEQIGIGISGTVVDDLAFKFPAADTLPSTKVTFPRGQGLGTPFGGEVVRIATEDQLVARTINGNNTTGGLIMWVTTLPAAMF